MLIVFAKGARKVEARDSLAPWFHRVAVLQAKNIQRKANNRQKFVTADSLTFIFVACGALLVELRMSSQ